MYVFVYVLFYSQENYRWILNKLQILVFVFLFVQLVYSSRNIFLFLFLFFPSGNCATSRAAVLIIQNKPTTTAHTQTQHSLT